MLLTLSIGNYLAAINQNHFIKIIKENIAVCWLRRDLRLHDHAALFHALKNHERVLLLFIFDTGILSELEEKKDRRVSFIYNAILQIREKLHTLGSSLKVAHGQPAEIFQDLLADYCITHVYANHDYEPYGMARDKAVAELLRNSGIAFSTFKDHVVFEKEEVVKQDGTPYTVFTPYSTRWKSVYTDATVRPYSVEQYYHHLLPLRPLPVPDLPSMGFEEIRVPAVVVHPDNTLIQSYSTTRDFPGIQGTSRFGVHLRFGTLSIREVVKLAHTFSPTFLNELIWREFYQQILWHFPHIGKGQAFRRSYDAIRWRNDEREFEAWCNGRTGYPLVDAGMRELNATGFMHNRVRMVVASFLSKHLLTDWRWGEAYFAGKLLDYELASNNGGWQWAAGSGCDAAPYFRIFNPTLQAKKFDPQLTYITRWVPDLNEYSYPAPIVEHSFARQRCIAAYSKAVSVPVK